MGNSLGPSLTGRYVIFILLLAGLVTTFAVPAREWFWQKSRIAELERTVGERQAAITELTAEEKRWGDPVYVAAQVRERLHFVRPGEVGYVVLTEEDVPAHTLPGHEAERQGPKPWWTTMWKSVQDASVPIPAASGSPAPVSPAPVSPAPISPGSASPAPGSPSASGSPSPSSR